MRVREIGCLVTGGSSGIGRAVALELGRRGCRVALLARGVAALESTSEEVRSAGGSAAPFPADVVDAEGLAATVERAASWAGGLRLAVVNAGVGLHGALDEVDLEAVRRTVTVNLTGALATVQAAIPHLLRSRPAALVGVSSLSGLIPYRGGGTYGATKAGLIAALRCLRVELAGRGVAVGWVCPGPVDTAMIVEGVPAERLPRLARWLVPIVTPVRVARAVVRSAQRGGGQKVLPLTAAFFASFARHLPRLAERVELLTGAGEA
jgi:3-oxoacyl-[acyl-carrier protein] reductase